MSGKKRGKKPGGGREGPDDAARLADSLQAIGRVLRQSAYAEAQQLPFALTAPQLLTLRVLVKAGQEHPGDRGLTLTELSRQVGLAHSTVSGIVTRLERAEIVARTVGRDRRETRIDIADEPRAWIAEQLPKRHQAPLAEALAGASEAERQAIVRGVTALERLLLGDGPAPPGIV
ncbi:MAG: MarR family winged helix-turn-helix transcriptional regulator [Actinomycetota bacterium]